ncbi:MAG: hypothetical protein GVY09_09505 [Gammaproteobacteria bacterium]|jgi:uncharacterized membrane protein YraQ (UPF0718 family)/copper chaperone CopZ|nr:hypothetical protein [Gammaproteobacteria bacterium]
MLDAVARFPAALWQILLELSPSLLLGLFIAGLVHVYVPAAAIHRRLSRPDLASTVRASLLGVPLPLCSCGVIPTALGLRKSGASPGATTSFMISTPQTGVDSILVSAAFLGWPFALFKLVAAFVTGVTGGVLVNRLTPAPAEAGADGETTLNSSGGDRGVSGAIRYAVLDLLAAIDLWLIAGVLVAALITTLVPADFFVGQSWAQGLVGMLVVLAISLPLYVCTTASVPIAASLIVAGMPAGSALVFLMAGPATNVATIGAVYRTLGASVLGLYLGTVVVMSLGFGLLFDQVLSAAPVLDAPHEHGGGLLATLSALVLLGLLGFLLWRRWQARASAGAPGGAGGAPDAGLVLHVQGMSCQHCVGSVKRSLEALERVHEAAPDLASGRVRISGGGCAVPALVQAVEDAGFTVSGVEKTPGCVDAPESLH